MKLQIILIAIICVFAVACSNSPQKFNSEKWKSGGKSVRGSMVEDLKESEILKNKTNSEIEQLLGKADESANDWLGYDVITISRCYIWNCRMEINFDSQTQKTKGDIAVSD